MRYEDNCIVFDGPIADLYDDTRPFMPVETEGKDLSRLCSLLQECARPASEYIELVDLGSGTGRVAIPLARQYTHYKQRFPTAPILRITCVDLSREMLDRLRAKWEELARDCNEAVELVCQQSDVRTLGHPEPLFDAAVAHWIFHLIEDWRLAAYAIDQALRPNGRLFLLTEQSPLYSAIDGDTRRVADEKCIELWRAFYAERAKFDSTSPRLRLGTLVVDDRIERMFEVLGWDDTGVELRMKWHNQRSLRWVIDKIIQPRSFTNMQLYPDNVAAASAYNEIANRLRTQFKASLDHCWQFESALKIGVFMRGERSKAPTTEVLIDVARATLSLRRQRPLKREASLVPVWGRLVRSTWRKINTSKGLSPSPLGGIMAPGDDNALGIFVSAPNTAGLNREDRVVARSVRPTLMWANGDSLWNELTSAMEVSEPFAICVGLSDAERERVREQWEAGARVHPPLHLLSVGTQVAEELTRAVSGKFDEARLEAQIRSTVWPAASSARWSMDFLDEASSKGLIPYDYGQFGPRFLAGIARIVGAGIPVTYLLPAVPSQGDVSVPALGFLVGAHRALSPEVATALWLLGEIVLSEYHAWVVAASTPQPPVAPSSAPSAISRATGPHAIAGAPSGKPVGDEDVMSRAVELLALHDQIIMSLYVIVGDYVRYEEETKERLRRVKNWIVAACLKPSAQLENVLIWAPSGHGKTFLIDEIARTNGFKYISIDLKEQDLNAASFKQKLEPCRGADGPHLCLVDEVDNRHQEDWPFAILYDFLGLNEKKGATASNDVFVLLGSTPPNIDALKKVIGGAWKGPDVISRISGEFEIPELSLGDRLLIVLSNLRRNAREQNRHLQAIEKSSLLYILCKSELSNARKLGDFIRRAIDRMSPGEDILCYGHLFDTGDHSKEYEFFNRENKNIAKLGRKYLYLV